MKYVKKLLRAVTLIHNIRISTNICDMENVKVLIYRGADV